MLQKKSLSSLIVKKMFLTECAAYVRYQHFSEFSFNKNLTQVGELFKKAALRKKELALQHLDMLKSVGDPDGSRQLPATDMPFDTVEQMLTSVISAEVDYGNYAYPTVCSRLISDSVEDLVPHFNNLSKESYQLADDFQLVLSELLNQR